MKNASQSRMNDIIINNTDHNLVGQADFEDREDIGDQADFEQSPQE